MKSAFLVVLVSALAMGGCRKKASAAQCSELLDHFAERVVAERFPDASAELVAAERARERAEANGDDAFKNCPSEVQTDEYACAMRAQTPPEIIKCLE